jgi:AAA+ superfamily predicted ATPase
MDTTHIFQAIDSLPDDDSRDRYEALVGLDDVKARLLKESELLLDPDRIERWSRENHDGVIRAVEALRRRTPLFVFAGDVGTGKTELAETFGDAVTRALGIGEILLFRLSLSARGTGAVGEMTRLLATAFAEIEQQLAPMRGGEINHAGILLIDEADALAQSRELAQMHHEDRAGVNALIRGIDRLAITRRPVLTVMASNRLSALDPAVRRRAAAVFEFHRPDDEQRRALLERVLTGVGLSHEQMTTLVHLTGPEHGNGRDYGYTYSDIVNRVVPGALIASYPDKPLTYEALVEEIAETAPTPPFIGETR